MLYISGFGFSDADHWAKNISHIFHFESLFLNKFANKAEISHIGSNRQEELSNQDQTSQANR